MIIKGAERSENQQKSKNISQIFSIFEEKIIKSNLGKCCPQFSFLRVSFFQVVPKFVVGFFFVYHAKPEAATAD